MKDPFAAGLVHGRYICSQLSDGQDRIVQVPEPHQHYEFTRSSSYNFSGKGITGGIKQWKLETSYYMGGHLEAQQRTKFPPEG
ncbi:hypothetical protein MUK42_03448 [Musa troglodytarum]|uniref:Uncharacterized protein n=1 Tax=Musa troglodytarum TaxID=320322 RepID=A0A9E7KFZ1_9LILI|nr:hypothetical protein MUK42_03448 [Musa troglodytarum]